MPLNCNVVVSAALKVMLTRICPANTMGTRHPHSITFHVGYALHSQGFVSSLHRLLSSSNSHLSLSLSSSVCLWVSQLHFAILCDGALEELSGYARAGPGLQRLSRHRLHFGEGETNTNWLSWQRNPQEIHPPVPVAARNEPSAVIRPSLIPLTPQAH